MSYLGTALYFNTFNKLEVCFYDPWFMAGGCGSVLIPPIIYIREKSRRIDCPP